MDITHLKYPNKSHRKVIIVPKKSSKLAEILGIIYGDGEVNNDWQVIISLNSISDNNFSNYVSKLINNIFNINISVKKRPNENCLKLTISSISFVEFIISLGMVKGNKIKQRLSIPIWVKNNPKYLKTFIRGLFDTDGCTYIDKHTYNTKVYRYLGLALTNYSPLLLQDVYNSLVRLGYAPTASTKWRVLLRREEEILKFFKEIKPSNKRHWIIFKKFLEEYRSGYNGTASKAVVRETGP